MFTLLPTRSNTPNARLVCLKNSQIQVKVLATSQPCTCGLDKPQFTILLAEYYNRWRIGVCPSLYIVLYFQTALFFREASDRQSASCCMGFTVLMKRLDQENFTERG